MRPATTSPIWFALLIAVSWVWPAGAETDAERRARLEVEEALAELAPYPKGQLHLRLGEPPRSGYELLESTWWLDGERLDVPTAARLSSPGRKRVWSGQVPAGLHEVQVRLRYRGLEYGQPFEVVVQRKATVEVKPGLAVALESRIDDLGIEDWDKRFQLDFDVRLRMVAAVEGADDLLRETPTSVEAGQEAAFGEPSAAGEEPAAAGQEAPAGEEPAPAIEEPAPRRQERRRLRTPSTSEPSSHAVPPASRTAAPETSATVSAPTLVAPAATDQGGTAERSETPPSSPGEDPQLEPEVELEIEPEAAYATETPEGPAVRPAPEAGIPVDGFPGSAEAQGRGISIWTWALLVLLVGGMILLMVPFRRRRVRT